MAKNTQTTTLRSAISQSLKDEQLAGIRFRVRTQSNWNDTKRVTFYTAGLFTAWHDVYEPHPRAYYIIPGYHPSLIKGQTCVAMINGDTDVVIRGRLIRGVYSPREARLEDDVVSSWYSMIHPFYAKGKSMVLDLNYDEMLTDEGIEELQKFLLALAGKDNSYVKVSGGFRSRLPEPKIIAEAAGLKVETIPGYGPARGSEGFCFWAYNTLVAEGELENAFIPPWFESEGWLEAYRRFGGEQ